MRIARYILLMLLLVACSTEPPASTPTPLIHLSDLQPLPVRLASEVVPLRVSVAAVVSPQGTVQSYQPLLDYLAATLDRPVELVQRQTYAETNDLIASGAVDIAFVCTSAYIEGQYQFDMTLLAAPEVNGAAVYHSVLIVPTNSSAQSMSDLQDSVFAFTDPMSFSGRVYPTYLVQQLGSTPEDFFSRTFFTYSHDRAIYAVADGVADGAAVDSLVYEFALQRESGLAERIRVIHQSPPFGIPPVVVSPETRPQLRAMLADALFNMDRSEAGRNALRALDVDDFIELEDSAYNSARQIIEQVGQIES